MIHTHKELGTVETANPITQGMVESYFDALGAKAPKSFATKTGNAIRCAADAGIILNTTPDQVAAWAPARCLWVAQVINKILGEALTIPPE